MLCDREHRVMEKTSTDLDFHRLLLVHAHGRQSFEGKSYGIVSADATAGGLVIPETLIDLLIDCTGAFGDRMAS